jgi:hypothetical protein
MYYGKIRDSRLFLPKELESAVQGELKVLYIPGPNQLTICPPDVYEKEFAHILNAEGTDTELWMHAHTEDAIKNGRSIKLDIHSQKSLSAERDISVAIFQNGPFLDVVKREDVDAYQKSIHSKQF